jgi:hypothetical protein
MVPVLGAQLTIMGESMDYWSLALGLTTIACAIRPLIGFRDGYRLMGLWFAIPLMSSLICSLYFLVLGFGVDIIQALTFKSL